MQILTKAIFEVNNWMMPLVYTGARKPLQKNKNKTESLTKIGPATGSQTKENRCLKRICMQEILTSYLERLKQYKYKKETAASLIKIEMVPLVYKQKTFLLKTHLQGGILNSNPERVKQCKSSRNQYLRWKIDWCHWFTKECVNHWNQNKNKTVSLTKIVVVRLVYKQKKIIA